jgi:sphingomyelin phosphodiesterase acid-like 3
MRRRDKLRLCLFGFILSSAVQIYAAPNEPERYVRGPGIVVSLSDIHFNPFYDPSLINALIRSDYTNWQLIFSRSSTQGYGTHSADSNYNLFNSALQNIYLRAPHPDFIIISGDFLAHDFQETYAKLTGSGDRKAVDSFTDKTTAFLTRMISRSLEIPDWKVKKDGQFEVDSWRLKIRNR